MRGRMPFSASSSCSAIAPAWNLAGDFQKMQRQHKDQKHRSESELEHQNQGTACAVEVVGKGYVNESC